MEPTMDSTQDLMVTSIDEMILRATKRYVELRTCIAEANVRREARKDLRRQKGVIDRLVTYRKALLSHRAGGSPPVIANSGEHVRWRQESRPQ